VRNGSPTVTLPRVRVLAARRIHPLTEADSRIVPAGGPCGEAEIATINGTGATQVLIRDLETWRPYTAVIAHDAGSLVFYLVCLDEEVAAGS